MTVNAVKIFTKALQNYRFKAVTINVLPHEQYPHVLHRHFLMARTSTISPWHDLQK